MQILRIPKDTQHLISTVLNLLQVSIFIGILSYPSRACRGFYHLVCFSNSNEKLSQHSCNFLFWCIICFFPSLLHKSFTSLWLLSVDLKHNQKVTCIAKLLTMSKWREDLCCWFSVSVQAACFPCLSLWVSISPLLPKALCFLSFALWVGLEFYFLLCWLLWSSAGFLCSLRAADDHSHLCEL